MQIYRNSAKTHVVVFSTIDARMHNSWKTKTAFRYDCNTENFV